MHQNTWKSVAGIIQYYGDAQDDFQPFAGPGNWNDPDMVRLCAVQRYCICIALDLCVCQVNG